MKTAYTKGPWEANGVGDVITSEGDVFMAPGDTHQEIEANAHLIAAAPELLEALETIYFSLDAGMTRRAVERLSNVARNAIAKAKGE